MYKRTEELYTKKNVLMVFFLSFCFFVSVLGSIFLINAVEVDAQEESIVGSIILVC